MPSPSFLISLERRLVISKDVWRLPSTRRTLPPIDIQATLLGLWRQASHEIDPRSITSWQLIRATLDAEGAVSGTPSQQDINWSHPLHSGVFRFCLREDGAIQVRLSSEACSSAFGAPRRESRHLANLRAGDSIRVLLNGRQSSHSGQYYVIAEYSLFICTNDLDAQPSTQVLDLQADLF